MWNTFSKKRQSKSLAAQLRGNVNVGNVNAGGNGVNYCDDEKESSSSSGSDDSISRDVPAAPNATNHSRTNNDSNDDDDDSVVQQAQVQQQRIYNKQRLDACTLFFSDLSFFFGSTMYLWLAVSESCQTILYGNSTSIEEAEAYNNMNYIDFFYDQTIFTFNNIFEINDNNNNDNYDYTSQVSLYMMYGFIASLLFCVTGLFKICLATADHWCDRLPYLFMVLASILGMISSSIIRLYPFISNILFCIEIHLFALQAATLVLSRFKTGPPPNIITTTTPTPSDGEHLTTITIATKFPWIRFIGGDILFLIATLTGIAYHESNVNKGLVQDNTEITKEEEEEEDVDIDHENKSSKSSNMFRFTTRNSNRKTTATTTNNIYNNQNNYNNNVKDDDDDDDTGSVISSWTVGPGPKNKDHITKSSLDDIFGRPVHRTKANMTYY
ncbi:hypothetical protein FRACYDRAFT_246872 [Fragilariopsis cylindrus CCMP1102]|uniref:Transmembrane protein n=1 Tax=Fragilariopsis cylindrus CCMP1102 TaxID=635003 RepID=A0A1E7EWX4_9STRA|nr:hypothetical protein FRACYDRAFT_246872 [Fragilariopsis cylindrus CCMP1102]|eukprot:OEU10461.1 hypothetical protein FRACYDRAFT_246872 [Fragilariopsis cylindrus CCMP1102]